MRISLRASLAFCTLSCVVGSALAQDTPLLHLPLDGDFQNHGSLPDEVLLRAKEGSVGPRPVPGKFGQALRFAGDSVLALPVDLSQAEYPDITLTAWVKYDEPSRGEHTIIGSGAATLRVHNYNMKVLARAGGGLFPRPERHIEPGEWTFIAAAVDLSTGEVRYDLDGQVHVQAVTDIEGPRGSRKYADPADGSIPSRPYIFVGANNFNFQWPATGISIDDVRIYKGALTANQIAVLRRGGVEAACTASDVEGTYRTAANIMPCSASGAMQLQCQYGPNSSNVLTLQINSAGDSATGTWRQPSGTGGSAVFDIDESCALANGSWGMGAGEADRPWDTTGLIVRADGTSDGGGNDDAGGTVVAGAGGTGTRGGFDDDVRPMLPMEPGDVAGDGGISSPPASCEAHQECGGGYYCGWDRSCHPESQLPIQGLELPADPIDVVMVPADPVPSEPGSEPEPEPAQQTLRPGPEAGDYSLSQLAGVAGENQIRLDFVDGFLTGIAWSETSDAPCEIGIIGWRPLQDRYGAVKATDERAFGPDCDDYPITTFETGHRVNMADPYNAAVVRLEVCNNTNRRNRLKGIRIWGSDVNDDGSTTFRDKMIEDDLPNCDTWSGSVICRIGEAATGVRVHANHVRGGNYEITGLQLICRKIGARSR